MAESKPDAGEEAALGSFVFFLAPTERFPLLIRGLQKSDSAFEASGGFPAGEESDRAHDEAETRDPEVDAQTRGVRKPKDSPVMSRTYGNLLHAQTLFVNHQPVAVLCSQSPEPFTVKVRVMN